MIGYRKDKGLVLFYEDIAEAPEGLAGSEECEEIYSGYRDAGSPFAGYGLSFFAAAVA